MRIRHPRSVPSARNADGIELTPNSSHDTSITDASTYPCHSASPVMMHVATRTSPPRSFKVEHISPTHSDPTEDNNTTYLKPDFLDPLTVTKSEPVCPSPLAMLAKTCQSIGQMMEASVNCLPPAQSASVMHRPVTNCSGSSTQVSPPAAGKIGKTKSHSPTEPKLAATGKRPFSGRTKWLKPDSQPTMNRNSPPTAKTDCVSSSQQSITNSLPNCGPTEVPQGTTIHHSQKPSNLSFLSNGFSSVSFPSHSPMNRPFSSEYTCPTISSPDTQTTSNALAQLARLSSSLSLPETPRTHTGNGLDNTPTKGRFSWAEPLRVQTGAKRARRYSGPKFCPNSASTAAAATSAGHPTSIPRKIGRDTFYHSQPGNDSNMGTSYAHPNHSSISPTTSQCTMSPQPTSRFSTAYSSANTSWMAFTQFMQQVMDQKDSNTQVHGVQPQEVFFYSLARSFIDLFYARMKTSQSSTPNLSHEYHPPKDASSPPREPPQYMDLFNSTSRIASNPSGFNSKPSPVGVEHAPIPQTLSSQCFLCGYKCSSQTELCIHVYSHLLMSEKEQAVRADPHRNGLVMDPKSLLPTSHPYAVSVSPTTEMHNSANSNFPLHSLPTPNYLSEWFSKNKGYGPTYPSANSNDTTSTVPNESSCEISASNPPAVDSALHSYWLKLLTAYTQNASNTKHPDSLVQRLVGAGFPASTSTLNTSPPVPNTNPVANNNLYTCNTSNQGLWNPLLFPLFSSNNSPLTLYPKV